MALSVNEVWRGGFVVDKTSGQVVTTPTTTNAKYWGGFLRDPDGRLVVKAV